MEVEFQFNTIKTTIKSNKDEKMKEICQKFCIVSKTSLDKVSFLYSGKVLKNELELTIQEVANNIDNDRNIMNILVNEIKIEPEEKQKFIKSKNVVCPQCGELGKISIEDYKYEISKCKNSHITPNIKVNELLDNLLIDKSKIFCDECKIKKSQLEENDFYRCNLCQKNLCFSCKIKHNKTHKIIKHEEKDFMCESHNEKYNSYCKNCNKNLCQKCFNEHNNHDILNYANIIVDNEINNEDLKININNVKAKIDFIKMRWKLLSGIFQEDINYFEHFYHFYSHILSNYDNNNIKYETLDNIINLKNSSIIKDLDKLNNSNDLNFLNDLINIYYNITTPKINEIIMTYKIKENVNNKINLFGKKFVERNKDKCFIDIEGNKNELISEYNFKDKKPGNVLTVKLIGFNNINDISYMFDGCDCLLFISNFEKINTFSFEDMSNLFSGCTSLEFLRDISRWNTFNVRKFSFMFNKCESLKSIPDISKWNTWRLIDIKSMFRDCKSLKSIPDLSKWNTLRITDISKLFYNCSSLDSIQLISKMELPSLIFCSDIDKGCKDKLKDTSNFTATKIFSNLKNTYF